MELFWDFFSATLGILAGLAVPTVAVMVLGLIILAITGVLGAIKDIAWRIKLKMKK
jgi:hypothetical protein